MYVRITESSDSKMTFEEHVMHAELTETETESERAYENIAYLVSTAATPPVFTRHKP